MFWTIKMLTTVGVQLYPMTKSEIAFTWIICWAHFHSTELYDWSDVHSFH